MTIIEFHSCTDSFTNIVSAHVIILLACIIRQMSQCNYVSLLHPIPPLAQVGCIIAASLLVTDEIHCSLPPLQNFFLPPEVKNKMESFIHKPTGGVAYSILAMGQHPPVISEGSRLWGHVVRFF